MRIRSVLLAVFGSALSCADRTPPAKPAVKLVCPNSGLDCTPFTRESAFKPATVGLLPRGTKSSFVKGFYQRLRFAGLCLDLPLINKSVINKSLDRVKKQGLGLRLDDIESFDFVAARVVTLSPVPEEQSPAPEEQSLVVAPRPSRRLSLLGKK